MVLAFLSLTYDIACVAYSYGYLSDTFFLLLISGSYGMG